MTSIYASGFDYDTDEVAVKKHFGKVGQIKELYFQSKGAAVITYQTEDAANRAVAELDRTTMKGQERYVAVHLDVRQRGNKGSDAAGKGGKTRSKGSGKEEGTAIYASGFDYDTDEYAVKKHFGKVGRIKELYFQSKGSVVITYETGDAANRAVAELDRTTMKGQERYVAVHLDVRQSWKKGSNDVGKGGKTRSKASGINGGAAIYASGFDYETDEYAVKKHFGKVGRIKELYFQSKGSVVITYETAGAADRAVTELDGSTMKGQARYVAVHHDVRSRGGKGKAW